MKTQLKGFSLILWKEFQKDTIPRRSAALSYYALFALVPLLILFISAAGLLVGEELVQERALSYFSSRFGESSVLFFENVFSSLQDKTANTLFVVIGLGITGYAATNLFRYLRRSFKEIFRTSEKDQHIIRQAVKEHTISAIYMGILFVLVFAFLFANVLISIFLRVLEEFLQDVFPLQAVIIQIPTFIFPLLILSALLSILYKLISKGRLSWKESSVGGIAASVLFTILNIIFVLFIAVNPIFSLYGAASFVIVFLIWIYYSAHVLFLGAEIAKVYRITRTP